MRKVVVMATTLDGVLLDRKEIDVPGGVGTLVVAPVEPGKDPIIHRNQVDLGIGMTPKLIRKPRKPRKAK